MQIKCQKGAQIFGLDESPTHCTQFHSVMLYGNELYVRFGAAQNHDAHLIFRNYAVRVSDWLQLFTVLEGSKPKSSEPEAKYKSALGNFLVYEAETMEFLEPFFLMRDAEKNHNYSPVTQDAQV